MVFLIELLIIYIILSRFYRCGAGFLTWTSPPLPAAFLRSLPPPSNTCRSTPTVTNYAHIISNNIHNKKQNNERYATPCAYTDYGVLMQTFARLGLSCHAASESTQSADITIQPSHKVKCIIKIK